MLAGRKVDTMDPRLTQSLRQIEAHLAVVPLRFPRAVGGGGGVGGLNPGDAIVAETLSVLGTSPPYVYVGRQVSSLAGGVVGAPYGIDLDGNLFNYAEIGANGVGVHSLPNGSIVIAFPDGKGGWVFDSSYYRGTYP